ncbi:MAG: hypothetical protein AAGD13_00660 [Pseudomonadota bacterium]
MLEDVIRQVVVLRACEIALEDGTGDAATVEAARAEMQQLASALPPIVRGKRGIAITGRIKLTPADNLDAPIAVLRRLDRALERDLKRLGSSDPRRRRMTEKRRAVVVRQIHELRRMAAVAPRSGFRGGQVYERAAVADLDRRGIEGDALARPRLSVPGGAEVVPILALAISPDLKAVASLYAADVDLVASGRMRGVDPAALRVDGGGASRSDPMIGMLEAKRRIEVGRKALMRVKGLRPARTRPGDKRKRIAARRLVDMMALDGETLAAVLRAHGWPNSPHARGQAIEVLEAALRKMR